MYQENIEDEKLQILRSLNQEAKQKLISRDNFINFGEHITFKLHKFGATLTDDVIDTVEFEITSAIEIA